MKRVATECQGTEASQKFLCKYFRDEHLSTLRKFYVSDDESTIASRKRTATNYRTHSENFKRRKKSGSFSYEENEVNFSRKFVQTYVLGAYPSS